MKKMKWFIIGAIFGLFLSGGVGYAASSLQIDVNFPALTYWLDNEQISPDSKRVTAGNGTEEVPSTIVYQGVSYVPLKWLSEAMGKEIRSISEDGAVKLYSVTPVAFHSVNPEECPNDIQLWVNQNLGQENVQFKQAGSSTYLLITRGKKNSGGYTVKVQKVRQYIDKVAVAYKTNDPAKGAIVSEGFTYPYDLVKVDALFETPVIFVK